MNPVLTSPGLLAAAAVCLVAVVAHLATSPSRRRIDARTLWTWVDRFGADTLVLALASDGGYAGLLRRLAADAPLDRAELELLAHLSWPQLFVETAFSADLARR